MAGDRPLDINIGWIQGNVPVVVRTVPEMAAEPVARYVTLDNSDPANPRRVTVAGGLYLVPDSTGALWLGEKNTPSSSAQRDFLSEAPYLLPLANHEVVGFVNYDLGAYIGRFADNAFHGAAHLELAVPEGSVVRASGVPSPVLLEGRFEEVELHDMTTATLLLAETSQDPVISVRDVTSLNALLPCLGEDTRISDVAELRLAAGTTRAEILENARLRNIDYLHLQAISNRTTVEVSGRTTAAAITTAAGTDVDLEDVGSLLLNHRDVKAPKVGDTGHRRVGSVAVWQSAGRVFDFEPGPNLMIQGKVDELLVNGPMSLDLSECDVTGRAAIQLTERGHDPLVCSSSSGAALSLSGAGTDDASVHGFVRMNHEQTRQFIEEISSAVLESWNDCPTRRAHDQRVRDAQRATPDGPGRPQPPAPTDRQPRRLARDLRKERRNRPNRGDRGTPFG